MGGLVVDGRLRFLLGNERERLKTPTIVVSVLMQVLFCVWFFVRGEEEEFGKGIYGRVDKYN